MIKELTSKGTQQQQQTIWRWHDEEKNETLFKGQINMRKNYSINNNNKIKGTGKDRSRITETKHNIKSE